MRRFSRITRNMPHLVVRLGLVVVAWLAWALASELAGVNFAGAQQPAKPVAIVDGQSIFAGDVRMFLPRRLRAQPLTELSDEAYQQAIRTSVDRYLVLRSLTRQQRAASNEDVQFEMEELQRRLAERKWTLENYLEQQQIDRETLARGLRWRISWKRYLERVLTVENLRRYFDQHRADFDGTTRQVSHILWKTSNSASTERKRIVAEASEWRDKIVQGQATWDEVAAEQSASPTAATGGQLGWISRHAPMEPAFQRAAFETAVGEISRPIETSVGIHLIRVLQERPGDKKFDDAVDDVRAAATRYVFSFVADQERTRADVWFALQHAGENVDEDADRNAAQGDTVAP